MQTERGQPKESVQANKSGIRKGEVSRHNDEVRVEEVKSYARQSLEKVSWELKLKGVELSEGFYVD